MAISITGVNPVVPSVQAQATVIQPNTIQADSQTQDTTTSNSSLNSSVQDAGMQSKQVQPDAPTTKNTTAKTQQNQQKKDTIELSPKARALMLRDKGRAVFEIAIVMNLDTKTVEGYLGASTVTKPTAQKALQDNQSLPTSPQPSNPVEVSSGNSAEKIAG